MFDVAQVILQPRSDLTQGPSELGMMKTDENGHRSPIGTGQRRKRAEKFIFPEINVQGICQEHRTVRLMPGLYKALWPQLISLTKP